MKKAAIAGLAALTLLDISAATPVAAQNASAFQGGYIGGHAGGATTNSMSFKSNPYNVTGLAQDPTEVYSIPGRNDEFDFNSFVGGVHSGFNFVTPGNFLFGIEGDWSILTGDDTVSFDSGFVVPNSGDNSDGASFMHRSQVDLEWQGTIRGRAGFIAGNTLFFATAGIAFLNADWKETATVTECGNSCDPGDPTTTRNYSDSSTLTGAVVGAGVEIAIAPNIIVGGDYLYETFDSFGSVPFGHTTPGQRGSLGDLDVHKVRVRVSVKFGAPAQ